LNTLKKHFKKNKNKIYIYLIKEMDYDLAFGKAHAKKKNTKLNKKMLDSMSLKNLKTLAKKHKVSCYKKGTKVCVKKSTLLKRLKKSRSVNKILQSASKMKKTNTHHRKVTKVRKSLYGQKNQLPANVPNFQTPLELSLGQTYGEQLRHYKSIPSTLISANFQGLGGNKMFRPLKKSTKNYLHFGTDKRSRSPEKNEPKYHFIFEDFNTDEDQEVEDILNDSDTKIGDIIRYSGNNQESERTARISRDKNGNKRLGPWRFTYDYSNFGKTKNQTNRAKMNQPYNFKFTQGSLGRSSLPSFYNINDPKWAKNYPHNFGRYFH